MRCVATQEGEEGGVDTEGGGRRERKGDRGRREREGGREEVT